MEYLDTKSSASIVEHLVWPAIPDNKSPALPAILRQLEESQWWPRDKLLSHQMTQIREVIKYSIKKIPFYQDRFKYFSFEEIGEFNAEFFQSLPILTRQELVGAGLSIVNLHPPVSHGKVLRGRTTGSSGRPLEYYGTQLTKLFWEAFTIREHLWHQRQFNGKMAVIRFGVENSLHDTWGPPLNQLYKTGPSATLNIKTDIEEQIAWLLRQNPDYLLSFPSNVLGIVRSMKTNSLSLSNLKQVRTVSEAFSPELKNIVRDVLGAKLVDVYSTCETGYVALQCPDYDHYHIQSEGVLVEILNDAGQACEPGETGRIVVTDLHNFAMPLIRYDLNDFATVGESCPCGRGLPVITVIKGRERNLVRLPNGKTYWPLLGFHKWMDIAPIEQIQVRQVALNELVVNLAMPRILEDSERRAFESILSDSLGHSFDIKYKYVDHIPPGPGGKYEEFVADF